MYKPKKNKINKKNYPEKQNQTWKTINKKKNKKLSIKKIKHEKQSIKNKKHPIKNKIKCTIAK